MLTVEYDVGLSRMVPRLIVGERRWSLQVHQPRRLHCTDDSRNLDWVEDLKETSNGPFLRKYDVFKTPSTHAFNLHQRKGLVRLLQCLVKRLHAMSRNPVFVMAEASGETLWYMQQFVYQRLLLFGI